MHRKWKGQKMDLLVVAAEREKQHTEEKKQWIRGVTIVGKRNRDFEYFSTIWRSFLGKPWLNRIADDREQRYVLGMDSEQNFSGVYAVITLSDSLKHFMGHGTVKVEYVLFNTLKPKCVTHFLVPKHVADDRQIFVRLDPSRQLRGKIVAWRVTIVDQDTRKEDTQSSFLWKKLM
jgi:hypothetical protein